MRLKIIPIAALFLAMAIVPANAKEWKEYKRQHFIIYYKEAPLAFVKDVEEAAEDYYVDIADDLGFTRYKGWSWENRALIYIFDNADDYVESGKQMGWSHGSASVRSKTIRTFPTAHGFFDSTLPHELGHIIFREFVGFESKIPAWFEEGVAMYQEKAKRWGAHKTVRKAIKDGTFKPLHRLTISFLRFNPDRASVNLFYAESASIINFMISELGDQRFVRLCRKLKDGDLFERALDSVYARLTSVDDLNEIWLKYLKDE